MEPYWISIPPPIVDKPTITRQSLGGIVVDDDEAELVGFEKGGTTAPGYVGAGYRHDGDAAKGQQKARYVPKLDADGNYRVSITYGAMNNRATNVPITVHHADGDTQVTVNQRSAPTGSGGLHDLGIFRFTAGQNGWVEISNAQTDGHVIIDAVRWQKVR